MLEKTGKMGLSSDRVTALAVAVASSDDPTATLEKVCGSVLGGIDVFVALKDLLDGGKKHDKGKGKDDDKHKYKYKNKTKGANNKRRVPTIHPFIAAPVW